MDHQIIGARLITKRTAKHQFRQSIFDAWRHQCAYCKSHADTLDHIRPRHRGGATVMANLVPACQRCNRNKGSEEWTEWFRQQITWTAFREADIRQWMSTYATEGLHGVIIPAI